MSKLDALIEGERRGVLSGSNAALLAEARRRGLVGGGEAAPEGLPESPLSNDPIVAFFGGSERTEQGIAAAIKSGLTFGGSDELSGLGADIGRGLGIHATSAKDAIEAERRKLSEFRQEHPVGAAAAEIAGSLPTFAVPGLGLARVGQAARAGNMGRAAGEGLRAGATYGAVSTPGRADVDPDDSIGEGLGKIATTGAVEIPLNAVGGAVGGAIGQKLGQGYDIVRRTVANNLTGRRSAETAFNKSLRESGTSAGDILNDVLPTHRNLTPERVEEAFTVMGEAMRRSNGNVQRATADTVNRLARQWGANPTTVRRQLTAMNERYAGRDSPLMLAERPGSQAALREAQARPGADDAEMMRFDDDQARQTVDYLANTPGRARSEVRAVIDRRLAQQGQQLRRVLSDSVGGQDFDTVAGQLDQALVTQGRAGYQAAMTAERQAVAANGGQSPLLPRLERTLDRFRRIYVGGRSGAVQDAMNRALGEFQTGIQVQGQAPVINIVGRLQEAMDARAAVRDMIDGLGPHDRTVRAALTRLYQRVTVDMRRTYPDWWRANQIWGDARTGERAMEFMLTMPRTPGVRQNRVLQQFDRLPPHQQDRARVAYIQQLHNQMGGPDSGDMLKWAKSENGRVVLRRILGNREAERLLLRLREFAHAKSTATMIGGSQTASRQATREAMDAPIEMAGQADALSLGGIRRAVTNYGIQKAKDRRNVPLGRIATTPMDRPDLVIPQLRRLQQAAARQSTGGTASSTMAQRLARALMVAAQQPNRVDDVRR